MIRRILLMAALTALIHLPAEGNFLSYDKGLQEVRQLVAAKRYADADLLLTRLLAAYPGNGDFLSLRGRVRFWNGRAAEGAADLRQALARRNDTDDLQLLVKMETAERLADAAARVARGERGETEALLRTMFRGGADRYGSGLLLAKLYATDGRMDDAAAVYRTLREEFPDDLEVTWLYVRTLLQKGDLPGAKQVADTVPEQNAFYLHIMHAAVHARENDAAAAVVRFRLALALRDDPEVRVELRRQENILKLRQADARLAAGDDAAAEALLQPLYREKDFSYDAGIRLARLARKRKDFTAAVGYLAEVRRDHTGDSDLLLALAEALADAGREADAQAQLLLVPAEVDASLRLRRARMYYRLHRYRDAVAEYAAMGDGYIPTLADERQTAEKGMLLAETAELATAGLKEHADALWQEVLPNGYDRYGDGYRIGMRSIRMREYRTAVDTFTRATTLYPADAGLFALAVESHLLARQYAEASAMVAAATPEQQAYLQREREDLLWRTKPNFVKVSFLSGHYSNDIQSSREAGVTVTQQVGTTAATLSSAIIDRYGHVEEEYGVEVSTPVWPGRNVRASVGITNAQNKHSWLVPFSSGTRPKVLPQLAVSAELERDTSYGTFSLGYRWADYRLSNSNVIVPGFTLSLLNDITFTERLYIGIDHGTITSLTTISHGDYRHKWFYSFAVGESLEAIPPEDLILGRKQDHLSTIFSLSNRAGFEYRFLPEISSGIEVFLEKRRVQRYLYEPHQKIQYSYSRYGLQLFMKYWW